jgi:uncharacterized protein (DUF362 family)
MGLLKPNIHNGNSMMNETSVGIIKARSHTYPRIAPFHPFERFPEYPFEDLSSEPNDVYSGLRELFMTLRLDEPHFNTKEWNPLGHIITPGDNVVIKPNFVMDRHVTGADYDCVVTHGSVIRAVLDYVVIALKGKGKIAIADAPMIDNDFQRIVERTGVGRVVDYLSARCDQISVFDLRVENVEMRDGLIVRRFKLAGDPAGYVPIDLGQDSEFAEIAQLSKRLRGSDYDSEETHRHHNQMVNEYLLCKSILQSDVFINVPKLKTHKKIGVTLNMKNLIGINGDKNWIPHYRVGSPKDMGDEFNTRSLLRHMESLLKDTFKEKAFKLVQRDSKAKLYVARLLRKAHKTVVDHTNITKIRAGGWYGNDTIWRSVLDLNKILLYADREGVMRFQRQRRFISVVDGIIGGEGDGPVLPSPKVSGVLLAGFNPLAVDICATRLMGFDYRSFAQFERGLKLKKYPIMPYDVRVIRCVSNLPEWCNILQKDGSMLQFKPATGWKGEIEIAANQSGMTNNPGCVRP